MATPQTDYSDALKKVVLTLSVSIVAGIVGTVAWMLLVPDVGEASFAAFFSGIVMTIFLLSVEGLILAIIYRRHRWIVVSLLAIPVLLVLAYVGFTSLLG